MSDEHELPSSGGSFIRDKNGRLRRTEEPTQEAGPPPAEPQEVVITPTPKEEA